MVPVYAKRYGSAQIVLSSGTANIRCHVEPAAAAKHLGSDAHARQTLRCAQGDIGWEVEDGAFRQT